MKLQEAEHHLTKSRGVQHKVAFQINASAKMMKLLSDDLYSDKIRAVIRELSCNAYDAHVEAGKPKLPYKVHLPTRAEQYFEIRDFGPGMSRDKLCNLYQTYGLSDKDSTNDMIGAWGLGSKSPLAYTNQFTVTNIHDGKKYVLVITKEQDGIPTLNFLCDGQDTTEPSGLAVRIPLRSASSYEYEEWKTKAQMVYKWFDVKPECNVELDLKHEQYLFDEGDAKLIGDSSIYSSKQSYAVMGNIAYPIEDVEGCSDILRHGAILYFDIGEVMMDPSRERLQYDKYTIAAIKTKVDKLRNAVQKKIDEALKDAKCLFDAVRIKTSYSGILDNFTWKYNGQDIPSYFNNRYGTFSRFYIFTNGVKVKASYYIYVRDKENYHFFDQDISATSHMRAEQFSKDNPDDVVYLISNDEKSDHSARAKIIEDNFGLLQGAVKKISSLPKPKIKRNKNNKGSKNVFEPDFGSSSSGTSSWSSGKYKNSDYWKPVDDFDIEDGGWYVEIDFFEVRQDEHSSWQPKHFGSLLERLQKLGISIPEYVAVKKKHIEKFEKHDDWEPLIPKLKELLEEHIEKQNFSKMFERINAYNNVSWGFSGNFSQISQLKLDRDHEISKFVRIVKKIKEMYSKNAGKMNEILELAGDLKLHVDTTSTTKNGVKKYDLDKKLETLMNKYSIINYVNINQSSVDLVSRVISEFGEH
jgi:hypothetical protein